MSDEPPDDYFEAAAGVVEAAKELDEARRLEREANDEHTRRFSELRAAEKKLGDAVENLGRASTPRR